MLAQLHITLPRRFIKRSDEQAGVNGNRYAMRWPVPTQFIDRAPGQNERRARTGRETKGFSPRENLVRGVSAQYDVDEVFEVFVLRNDARRNAVILDGNAAPADRGTGPRGLHA